MLKWYQYLSHYTIEIQELIVALPQNNIVWLIIYLHQEILTCKINIWLRLRWQKQAISIVKYHFRNLKRLLFLFPSFLSLLFSSFKQTWYLSFFLLQRDVAGYINACSSFELILYSLPSLKGEDYWAYINVLKNGIWKMLGFLLYTERRETEWKW